MTLVAHRTPASAARCAHLAAAGAAMFEVDVQLRGGHVAVSHYRPVGPAGRLQRDNWRLRWHTRSRLDPALTDVDSVVPPGCRVLLDVKEVAPARRRELVAVLGDELAAAPDRYVLCSPFQDDLEAARAAGFATWRTVRTRGELAAVRTGPRLADEAVTVRHSLLDAPVRADLVERVDAVVAWTVNDVRRARELRRLGVTGVTTDRIEVLRTLSSG
jgi:hypothetical protein